MVVDDDAGIREVLHAFLQPEGYPAVTAADCREALEQLRSGLRPAVILLDLVMPGMDGRAFWKLKQADPALASIPVVVISGDEAAARFAAELGCEFIQKPFELERLLRVVKRHCFAPA